MLLTSRARFLMLLAVVLFAAAHGFAQSERTGQRRRGRETAQRNPPTVTLSTAHSVLTLCDRDAARAMTMVRLKADARSPDGYPLRYTWTVSGGRVVGVGADPTWDLTGVSPGVYTAQVDVISGPDPDCTALATTVVRVVACPPQREFCPSISINCPEVEKTGSTITFSADVTGGTPGITSSYNWTVTAGSIVSGQGTSTIQVDTTGLGGRDIKAVVEVGGYGRICSANCTTQTQPPIKGFPFDQVGDVSFNDEKARLDNFAVELQNDTTARGYLIAYGGTRQATAQQRAARARGYLINTRGIDAARIVTLTGGSSERPSRLELWIVPAGAEPPTPRQ